MTEERFAYACKLRNSIATTEKILRAPISLDLVVRYAKESASVIKYLDKEQVDKLKEEVRSALTKELQKMQDEFHKL